MFEVLKSIMHGIEVGSQNGGSGKPSCNIVNGILMFPQCLVSQVRM